MDRVPDNGRCCEHGSSSWSQPAARLSGHPSVTWTADGVVVWASCGADHARDARVWRARLVHRRRCLHRLGDRARRWDDRRKPRGVDGAERQTTRIAGARSHDLRRWCPGDIRGMCLCRTRGVRFPPRPHPGLDRCVHRRHRRRELRRAGVENPHGWTLGALRLGAGVDIPDGHVEGGTRRTQHMAEPFSPTVPRFKRQSQSAVPAADTSGFVQTALVPLRAAHASREKPLRRRSASAQFPSSLTGNFLKARSTDFATYFSRLSPISLFTSAR